jgi:Ca2+-binding RTX toxin-like protein
LWAGATVFALGGNDWIDLRPCTGTMTIFGGGGDDRMWAGSEGSTMSGGDGWDWMTGGAGDDWFYAVDGQMDVLSGGGQVQGDYAQIDYPNFDTGNDTDWINGIEFVDYKFYP